MGTRAKGDVGASNIGVCEENVCVDVCHVSIIDGFFGEEDAEFGGCDFFHWESALSHSECFDLSIPFLVV